MNDDVQKFVCVGPIDEKLRSTQLGWKKQHNYPPYIRGWLPWFGVAFQFGRAPLDFVEKARAKYGPVFTVLAAGKRLTFITLHEDFNTFFTSKDVDFQQAVQDPVRHTEKDSFNKNHHICHAFIKERLTRSNLSVFFADLCDDFNNQLKLMKQEGSDDLADIVRCLMYPAVMSNLLGKECCPNCQTEKEEFKKHFLVYDEGFEYGTQLPEFFLREWANSKTWLLTFMENIIFQAQKNKPSKADAKNYIIPPGDLLMLSPFWAHRNPKLFPDPEKFIPERWKHSDLEKNVFLEGFVAFGGGRYQCPGSSKWILQLNATLIILEQVISPTTSAIALLAYHPQEIPPGPVDITSGSKPMEEDLVGSGPFDVTSGLEPMADDPYKPKPSDFTSCLPL
ncbi:CP39A hydroxylase, partial [Polypterus senegalus]